VYEVQYVLYMCGTALLLTSGFWPRVRARALRAPVFFRLINMQNGALRVPPAHRSFAASYLQPKTFPQARTQAVRGAYIFPLG
jgi:hypothetical protein